ncbi:MAG: DUF721 domain-containing protein [Acidobacteria bacterium]|nr:DUF721 domain-containing protein [Acidobacteriota bacterium]
MSKWILEASDFEEEYAEPLGDVLRRWARRSGLLRLTDRQRVWGAWHRLLGPDAAHTSLEGLKNHVATFTVDSSALLSELNNFRKADLLEGIREDVKTYFVRDIRFRLVKSRSPAAGGRPSERK